MTLLKVKSHVTFQHETCGLWSLLLTGDAPKLNSLAETENHD